MDPNQLSSTIYLSVIVPVLNEEGSVASLYAEILAVCRKLNKPFEIIFIDDGSTDDTVGILGKLSPIRLIRLRRNFGQTAAMDAGIKAAKGRYLATLDGDGQNDPRVHLLQEDLRDLGFLPRNWVLTDSYGPVTRAGVLLYKLSLLRRY